MLLKRLFYKVSLLTNIVRHAIAPQRWSWWSPITPQIILGAIPLKNKGDLDRLVNQEKISAVLTVLQPFEWQTKGLFSVPVTPADWQAHGIPHLQIVATDLEPLTQEQIEQGVEFIHQQVKQGKRVYVHCKAGRGRSASIVVCYLLKYGDFATVDEAIAFVQQRRRQISINAEQRVSIDIFEKRIQHEDTKAQRAR